MFVSDVAGSELFYKIIGKDNVSTYFVLASSEMYLCC